MERLLSFRTTNFEPTVSGILLSKQPSPVSSIERLLPTRLSAVKSLLWSALLGLFSSPSGE